jgi:hypothetical protein
MTGVSIYDASIRGVSTWGTSRFIKDDNPPPNILCIALKRESPMDWLPCWPRPWNPTWRGVPTPVWCPIRRGWEGVVDVSIVLQNWHATFQPRRCVPEIASDPDKAIGVATRGAGALIFVLHKQVSEIHKTKFITTTIIGPKVIRTTTENSR